MIVDRYRVLLTIKGRKVHVLHVRGAYPGARLRMISRLENLSAQFLMVIIALLLAVLRQNLILIDSVAFLASDRTLLA